MSALQDALDAMQYAGGVLEKPGRAVRGLLAGNAREGLAALPFSDALGLTDARERTTGEDLLKHYGVDAGSELGNGALGFGVDLATDPLTYFGGALARKAFGFGSKAAHSGETLGDAIDALRPSIPAADEATIAAIDADRAAALARFDGLTPRADELSAIEQYPDFKNFSHLVGDPLAADAPSVASDAALDGLGPDAVARVRAGAWDEALRGLGAVPPDVRGMVAADPQWQPALLTRLAELAGAADHPAAIRLPPDLAPGAGDQLGRVHELLGLTPADYRTPGGALDLPALRAHLVGPAPGFDQRLAELLDLIASNQHGAR